MNIATIGIDLAKNVFQLHGVNCHGKVVLRRQIHRGQMRGLFVNLPPCLIGMEACASASISEVRSFKNGRELAAWLGLVPRQHSSGGKPTLLGISKRGDRYLRTLLVHGARSVIVRTRKREDEKGSWLKKLLERRHINIATVALAHRTVRTVWAMLAHDREYCPNYKSLPVAA